MPNHLHIHRENNSFSSFWYEISNFLDSHSLSLSAVSQVPRCDSSSWSDHLPADRMSRSAPDYNVSSRWRPPTTIIRNRGIIASHFICFRSRSISRISRQSSRRPANRSRRPNCAGHERASTKKNVCLVFFYCYYSLWFVIRKRDLKMISGLKCLDFSRHRREGRVVSADWETQRKKAKEMLQSRKKIVSSLLTCLVVVCRLPFRSVKSFFQDFQFN